jgi:uncharacterized protein YrrD
MQLKEGATIYTAEGKRVGSLDRFVLDPRSKEVTGIVVRKGILFGEDKVVPMSLVSTVTEEGDINLRPAAADLEELPNFTETEYVPSGVHRTPRTVDQPEDLTVDRSVYWYPPVGYGAWGAPGSTTITQPVPEYVLETSRNIPEGTVALKRGAKVLSSDDEQVGDVEEVLTEPMADRATHLVISEGLLLKEKKLVPTHWITAVLEDSVVLAVDAETIEDLPEYAS